MTANPVDRHVGSRVRIRRLMIGLSQEQLAKALDISRQDVLEFESGERRAGAERLQRLSKILKTPPSFFFDGAPWSSSQVRGFEEVGTGSDLLEHLLSPESLQLNFIFSTVEDPKLRRRILEMVEQAVRVWRSAAHQAAGLDSNLGQP